MKYWEAIEKSQERMARDFPNGKEGMKAVHVIRSFFEQIGTEQLSQYHPLTNRLRIGYEPNYSWLVHYARKLLTAKQLLGFEGVAKRFSDPKEYLAANAETETALKLYLSGLDVSFCRQTRQPVCDLGVKLDNTFVGVEVTSLNPSDEELLVDTLVSQVNVLGFTSDIAAGGFVSRVKSAQVLEEVLSQVKQAIEEVKVSGKIKKLNYKGVATIYLAPESMVDQMPADCRRQFAYSHPSRLSIEDQIKRKIAGKDRQLQNGLGILFINTRMIDRESLSKLFDQSTSVDITLASYPMLLGLVLTVPHLGIEVVSGQTIEHLEKRSSDNKVFLETEVGPFQYESSLLWKNLHADLAFPAEFTQALMDYSSNLNALLPLRDNF
jgi:hypothetical protein